MGRSITGLENDGRPTGHGDPRSIQDEPMAIDGDREGVDRLARGGAA
jgi:hypothetical protein